MGLFNPANRDKSESHRRLFAIYEIVFTVVDFSAAILFVIGSILFFREATTYIATWMFLLGSICFALKPTIRLARELHYWQLGDVNRLAQRAED
jgi:uncharacterized membrane protein YgdD (TMEM256/DUF423 family)